MKIKLSLTLLGLLFCLSGHAQHSGDSVRYPLNRLSIKWSPLHTLDFFSTMQIAVEQRIAKSFSLQYDFGVVVPASVKHSMYHSQHGYKAKLQGRYYIDPRTRYWSFFIGPEVYYNHVDYQQSDTYIVHPNNYYQYISHDVHYRERGVALKIGALFKVRRFCIDFQVGVAGRIVDNVSIDAPLLPTYELVEPRYHFLDSATPLKPAEGSNIQQIRPTLGIRFGYIILK